MEKDKMKYLDFEKEVAKLLKQHPFFKGSKKTVSACKACYKSGMSIEQTYKFLLI